MSVRGLDTARPAAAGVHRAPRRRGYPLIGVLPYLRRDPIGFFVESSHELGDAVELNLAWNTGLLITGPEFIKYVLQDNRANYPKSRYLEVLRPLVGDGLFLAEGSDWRERRRTAAKAFQGSYLKPMTRRIAEAAGEMIARWRPLARNAESIDVVPEAMRLTLDVILRSMFGFPLGAQHKTVYDAVSTLMRDMERRFWALANAPDWAPTPNNLRRRAALRAMDRFVAEIVARRSAASEPHEDLLQVLIGAYGAGADGALPADLLRNEVLTFVIAGQDTTASALAWTWYLLSKHPEVARRVTAEVDSVLGGRAPEFEDLAELGYLRMVFQEAMRLYPPAWTFSREAREDDLIGDFEVRKGTTIIIAPCAVHRRPDLWPDPERFEPERFEPDRVAARHRFAYIPFGGGPRNCLGARFAEMEALTVLAMVAQAFRLEVPPGHRAEPEPMFIQRPRGGLPLILREA
jgi:cytochrome P450